MILVAFVLVLFATVMLIMGAVIVDTNQLVYIWAAIAACFATFAVLGASWYSRRRQTAGPAAAPAPLGADGPRIAPTRSAPRATTLTDAPADAPLVDVSEQDQTTVIAAVDVEESVKVVEPVRSMADEIIDEDPEVTEAPAEEAPAPRPVAPRRVVRRAAPAAAAPVAAAPVAAASTAPAEPASAPAAAATPTVKRVVRRAPAPGAGAATATPTATRKVVRRVAPAEGAARAAGATAATPTTTTKVVRRVARPAGTTATSASAVAAKPATRTVAVKPTTPTVAAKRPAGTRGAKARAVLSEIKGVGPAKQDALLKAFGSLEAMAAASVEELTAIRGVGEAVAIELKQTLQAR